MHELVLNEGTPEERTYQIDKLDAMKQFHLVRRLGPVLVVAGVTLDMLHRGMKIELGDIVAMAGPVMEIMSKMPDDEAEYLVFLCLGVVKIKQANGWAPMTTPDGKKLMFGNLEMPEMLRVVIEVLKDNLGNFLTGLRGELTSQSSSVPGQPATTK